MIGDQQDMVRRIKAVLPTRWFADEAPVLDVVLSGVAWGWAWAYQLLSYVKAQTRISTASDVWLDVIAQDFFGNRLVRRAGQGDDAFRLAIKREIFRERGTRAAIVDSLVDITGQPPTVFEPRRTTDTGGYGSVPDGGGRLAYGRAGGWGSLALPFQCFVTAYRSVGTGIANVNGYANGAGGYGMGVLEYASLTMIQGQVTDSDIQAAIAGVMPAATIAWTAIANNESTPAVPGQVSALSVGSRTLDKVGLKWTAPSEAVQGLTYLLLVRSGGASQWCIGAAGIASTDYTISDLNPGTAYSFLVLAQSTAGPGPASTPVDVVTFSTLITWGVMPPAGTYQHSTGGIPINVATSPNPSGVNFGWSASSVVPPLTTTPGSLFNGNYWGDYLNAPATVGTFYMWVLASDGSGQLVSGPIAIT